MFYKRTKIIPWNKFFKIEKDEMVTLRVIPDRTTDNKQNYKLIRALHELYTSPLGRFSFGKWFISYRPQDRVWYDVVITKDTIKYYFTVPKKWETYAKQKMATCWEKASIDVAERSETQVPVDNTCISEVVYKRHNMFAIHVDRAEDTQPVGAIMQVSRDMLEDDKLRLSVCMEPANRMNWNDESNQAHKEFEKGKTPQRLGFNKRKILLGVGRIIEGILEGLRNFVITLLGHDEEKGNIYDQDRKEILLDGKLDRTTINKKTEPIFKTNIRIASYSKNQDRQELNSRAVANAFVEVAGDNELDRVEVRKRARVKIIYELNGYKLKPSTIYGPDATVMSSSELGKIAQIPGAGLQDEYKAQLESIELRQVAPPKDITSGGIPLGEVQHKNNTNTVYMPIKDYDELCLGRVVIGGKGTGKTRGLAANWAVEAVRNNLGALLIDPAKSEMITEISSMLPPEDIIHVDLSKQKILLSWEEVKHSPRAKTRLANTIIGFFNTNSDESGGQTSRYLKAAVMAMQTGKLNEIIRIFEDEVYRRKVVKAMPESISKTTLLKFDKLSDARQAQIVDPIYNRLDIILSDEYLSECMDDGEPLDMVELLSQRKAVVVDIPSKFFDPLAIDLLVNLISTKIDLAMRLREEENQFPYFIIFDEPHQYLKSATLWKAAAVESRKWRLGYMWLFHSWDQIPKDLANIIKSSGPHYHIYTSSEETYKSLSLQIAPFTVNDGIHTPTHHAINVLRVNGKKIAPFMAKMMAPPSMRVVGG